MAGKKQQEGSIRHQYEYDNCNRLVNEIEYLTGGKTQEIKAEEITTQYTYDKQGNLLSDGSFQYTYDGFNRMVRAEDIQGDIQRNCRKKLCRIPKKGQAEGRHNTIARAYDSCGRLTRIFAVNLKRIIKLLDEK